jgi:hypothetical protein
LTLLLTVWLRCSHRAGACVAALRGAGAARIVAVDINTANSPAASSYCC